MKSLFDIAGLPEHWEHLVHNVCCPRRRRAAVGPTPPGWTGPQPPSQLSASHPMRSSPSSPPSALSPSAPTMPKRADDPLGLSPGVPSRVETEEESESSSSSTSRDSRGNIKPGPWSLRHPRYNGGRKWDPKYVGEQEFDWSAIGWPGLWARHQIKQPTWDARHIITAKENSRPTPKPTPGKKKGGGRAKPNLSLEAVRIVERALGENLTAIEKRVKIHQKKRRDLHVRLDRLPNGSPLFGLYPPPPTKIPRKRNKRKNVSSSHSPPDPDVATGPLPPMASSTPLFEQPPLPPFPVFSTGRPIASAATPPSDDPPATSPPSTAEPEKLADVEPATVSSTPDDFKDDEEGMPIEDDLNSDDERRIAAFVPDPAPPEDWDREIRVVENMRRPRGRGRGKRNV